MKLQEVTDEKVGNQIFDDDDDDGDDENLGGVSNSPNKQNASQNGKSNNKRKLNESENGNDSGMNPAVSDDTARIPRTFDVEVRADLVNLCIPGDVLRVVGVIKAMQSEPPRFNRGGGGGGRGRGGRGAMGSESGLHQLYLVANSLQCVKPSGDRQERGSTSSSGNGGGSTGEGDNPTVMGLGKPSLSTFSPAELNAVRGIALGTGYRDEIGRVVGAGVGGRIGTVAMLTASLCPSIYGHDLVKLGLLLGLFGGTAMGVSPDTNDENGGTGDSSNNQTSSTVDDNEIVGGIKKGGFNVRADIHVLIVGDPGLGKSQLLRSVSGVAPRSVFVCGNTTTAAGLTVAVSKESGGRGDVVIEAGALVSLIGWVDF